jgi:Tol biopolymer transport system component
VVAEYACSPSTAKAETRLQYVTTASQYGPVGFRDPVGSISPDGRWLAYGEGREVEVQRVEGGPVHVLGALESQVRYLAWLPDSRRIAAFEGGRGVPRRRWLVLDLEGAREELWAGKKLEGTGHASTREIDPGDLNDLVWSPDGARVAGVARTETGSQLWVVDAIEGKGSYLDSDSDARLSYPAFAPGGEIACLAYAGGRQVLELPCGKSSAASASSPEVYGPVAFSPDGADIYYATPDERGFLDLWSRRLSEGTALQLSSFDRDTYAPSVAKDGRVLFRRQTYRTFLATAPAAGGPSRELTTFQSETPSWNWNGSEVGFTFGSWRRIIDDFHYPDISQNLGTLRTNDAPAAEPGRRVRASSSEDQGMFWSPNGRWIALHSHFGSNDDVWIQPSDGSETAHIITHGGYETGWPRWSKDGKWLLYTSYTADRSKSAVYVVGMDQETGKVTEAQRQVDLDGYAHDAVMAEWSPDGESIFFEGAGPPGRKGLYQVSRKGGTPRKIHEFACEQTYSGLSVSPDGRWIAFVAPASDGYLQIFRVPSSGGDVEPITTDPTNKTQPAYSPDGKQIAFTIWTYQSQFWLLSR